MKGGEMPLETEIKFKPVLEAADARRVAAETAAIFEERLANLGKPMSYSWVLGQVEQQQKAATGGGGLGGAAAAGGVAGAAAAGMFLLVQAIDKAVKQSKIVSTVQETIGKALGLLIDVVLMPFLPILTMGIVWLFKGIMLFHKLWSDIWDSKVIHMMKDGLQTLAGLLAIPMKFLWDMTLGGALTALDKSLQFIIWLWENAFTLPKVTLSVLSDPVKSGKGVLDFLYNLWLAGGKLFWELIEKPKTYASQSVPGVEAGVDENWFKPSRKSQAGWDNIETPAFQDRRVGTVNVGGITVNIPTLERMAEEITAKVFIELTSRGLI